MQNSIYSDENRTTDAQFVERRRHVRLVPKDSTIVITTHIIGGLLNICKGGMAFEFYTNEFSLDEDTPCVHLGLFANESGLLIPDIHCKIVKIDTIIQDSVFLPLIRKKCSVAFIDLTAIQKERLKHLLATI